MTILTKEVDMKRMLNNKLPKFVLCWGIVIGMVLASSPAFSREKGSSYGNDSACDWDRYNDRDRSYDSDRGRDRSRGRDRDCDRDRSRGRDSSGTVRIVHKGDLFPAILATGLIAGITCSLFDNDDTPAYRASSPVYCPGAAGQAIVSRSVMVTAGLLNIRSGPGLHRPCTGKIYRGTVLSIVKISGDWYYIMTPDGVSGWVMAQYTTPVGSAANG
jgi:uncharacterized protein YgiM (DUF1202 family)